MPVTKTEIFPYIFYRDVPAALEWLTRAFGFKEKMRTTPPVVHGIVTQLPRSRKTGSQQTPRWRKMDSNTRFLMGTGRRC